MHEFATGLSENVAHTAGRVKTLPYNHITILSGLREVTIFIRTVHELSAGTAGRVKTLPYMIFLEKCTLEKSP